MCAWVIKFKSKKNHLYGICTIYSLNPKWHQKPLKGVKKKNFRKPNVCDLNATFNEYAKPQ